MIGNHCRLAERHPHADLPGALFHEVRQHAEEPGYRQQ
jgi:hypothetical protein